MAGEIGYTCTIYVQPNTLKDLTMTYATTNGSFTKTLSNFTKSGDYLTYFFDENDCARGIPPDNVLVSSTGYKTASATFAFGHDKEYITLESDTPQYTLTVSPTPSDATVMIDGEEKTSITVDENTLVNYEVSKDGYKTVSGEYTVTEDKTLNIELEEESYISEIEVNGEVYDVRDKNIYTKEEVHTMLNALRVELGLKAINF